MSPPPLPRTLILDYYDSYTNNLVTLFTQIYSDEEVLKKVVVVKADKYTWAEFQEHVLPHIDCVILSPGPGRPDNPVDIGFALDLLRQHSVPVLGVCLGHQAIGVAFGGKIINTPKITHGHVVKIAPTKPAIGLFASPFWDSLASEQFEVVVYNSLAVEPESLPDELEVTAWSVPAPDRPSSIQGLRHKTYPIWGVQYHPESISSTRGASLLQAFLHEVSIHHKHPSTFPALSPSIVASCAYRVVSTSSTPSEQPGATLIPNGSGHKPLSAVQEQFGDLGVELKTQDVFERLVRIPSRKGKEKAVGEVWLDGQTPTRATTTSLASPSFLLTYSLTTRTVTLQRPSSPPATLTLPESTTFWDWFSAGQDAITSSLSSDGEKWTGGWRGGWVGWFAYEMKEESLSGYKRRALGEGVEDVDACWGWADGFLERAQDGKWTARGIARQEGSAGSGGGDDMLGWLGKQGVTIGMSDEWWAAYLAEVHTVLQSPSSSPLTTPAPAFPTFHPRGSGTDYHRKIDECREAIHQGESYELTLTTRFAASAPSLDPYALYLRLRTFNPAYYSTYMYFPGVVTPRGEGLSVLSSSPERFLKIDGERRVEMMPIKGTRARVKAGECVCSEGVGCEGKEKGGAVCVEEAKREDARRGDELQNDLKERAENLMIVDLIRSDLLSCCIPSTVTVPKLIALESYGVHNLVTTVQGTLADNVGSVEAVRRCFPPGSMTGAPKLRSVQLLDGFEDHERRGIYSGALGYISVDGISDLSVVIRTIIVEGHNLSIGAGGAITWLSDPAKEWDEVLTKVKSVVGALDLEGAREDQ
ncbi:hypothetical protein IAT38_004998 [Cryptococcus sp. DSM 104549]